MISTDSVTNLKFQIYIFFSQNIPQCLIWYFSTVQLGEKHTRKLVDHKGHLPIPHHNHKCWDDLHKYHVCIRSFFGKYYNFDPSTHHGNWKKKKKYNVGFNKISDLENRFRQKMKSYMQSLGLTQSPCLQSLHSAEKKLSY